MQDIIQLIKLHLSGGLNNHWDEKGSHKNCLDSYLPHMVLNRFVDPAITVFGMGRIDFINLQFDGQVIF